MTHTSTETTTAPGFIEEPSHREGGLSKAVKFFRALLHHPVGQVSLGMTLLTGTPACKNLGGVETNDELVQAGFKATACEFTKKDGNTIAYYKFGEAASCKTRAKIISLHGIDQDGIASASMASHLIPERLETFASVDTVAHGKTPRPNYIRPKDMNPVTAANFTEEFIHDQFDGQEGTILICHSAAASECIKLLDGLPDTRAILVNPALPIKLNKKWSNKNIRIPSRWVAPDCSSYFAPGVIHKGATAQLKEGWNNGPELIEMSLNKKIIAQANQSNRSIEIIPGNTTQSYPTDPNKNTPVERVRADLKVNCRAINSYMESIRTIRLIKKWGEEVLAALERNRERIRVILDPSDAVINAPITQDFLRSEFGIEAEMVDLHGGHSVHLTNPKGLVKAMFPEKKENKPKDESKKRKRRPHRPVSVAMAE